MPPEAVEIIDESSSHKTLERPVNVGKSDALFEHLVPVYINKDLGDGREECGHDAGQLRSFVGCRHKLRRIFRKEADILSCPVLENERDPSRDADAGNCGWGERKPYRPVYLCQLLVEVGLDSFIFLFRFFSFRPVFKGDEKERAVCC